MKSHRRIGEIFQALGLRQNFKPSLGHFHLWGLRVVICRKKDHERGADRRIEPECEPEHARAEVERGLKRLTGGAGRVWADDCGQGAPPIVDRLRQTFRPFRTR